MEITGYAYNGYRTKQRGSGAEVEQPMHFVFSTFKF